jgi:hypothetical protein
MSDGSFVSSFQLIEKNIFPALIDPTGLSMLRSLCGQLPQGLATFWGLECRLGEVQPRADILFEIKRNSPGHRLISGQEPSSFDRLSGEFAVWARMRDFARRWADEDQPGMAEIHNLWLEFDSATASDLDDAAALVASPSLFWGTDVSAQTSPDKLHPLFEEMAKFYGDIIVPEYLFDVVRSLPQGAVFFQAGMMISRQQPVVRLCVNKLSGADSLKWLADIGWPGDIDKLATLFDHLRPAVDNVALDLDLSASGVHQILGLECYQPWAEMDATQWMPLFDMQVDWELSRQDKASAVLAYPGRGMSLKDNVIGDATHTFYAMNIHHLKLVFRDARVDEAKAYLGLHRPGIRYGEIMGESSGPDGDGWFNK